MNKLMKILPILFVVLLLLTTASFATDISMTLSNNVSVQSNTQSGNTQTPNTQVTNTQVQSNTVSSNGITDAFGETDTRASNKIATQGTSTTVSSVTSTSSDEGLTFGGVLNILLIVVGIVLILLGIAIIIRLK